MKSFGTSLRCICISVSACFFLCAQVSAGCSDEDFAKSHELYKLAIEEQDLGKKTRMFEEAFDICPDHGSHAEGYFLLGKIYWEAGDHEKAMNRLLKANRFRAILLQRSKSYLAETNRLLGELFKMNGDAEKASLHFRTSEALAAYEDSKLQKDLIDNYYNAMSVIYTPGTLKNVLSSPDEIPLEYRSKLAKTDIFFHRNSSMLDKAGKQMLDNLLEALRDNSFKGSWLIIEGHTDEAGDKKRNCALGRSRADAVVQYLNNNWQNPHVQFVTVNCGQFRPIVSRTQTESAQWARIDTLNRRVTIWNAGKEKPTFRDKSLEAIESCN
ncbi:MAG: OmpA family protein [Desulfomonile tiedjei]|uniref:OmpA family protein n=1 Tax=Desulfomonile tiedjei TaxID=2358 RepID=A0A9D6Z7H4_9BACT|nr:OmpA family protein [Desulfomonile tiedjei]